jgi:hypothetical protein
VFGLTKKKNSVAAQSTSPKSEVWGDIYTMPIVTPSGQATVVTYSEPKSKRRWLIISLMVLLLAIGGVGIYLTFFSKIQPSQPSINTTNTTPSVAPTTEPTTPPVTVQVPPASERDNIRYQNIIKLQEALGRYATDNQGKYPIVPLPLVLGSGNSVVLSSAGWGPQAQGTIYLEQVPQNIAPGGVDYLYDSFDGVTYTISFRLEEGSNSLTAGDHKLTPAGIDTDASIIPPTPPNGPRQATPPSPSVDSDNDGLTNATEPLLGADPSKIDTDNDGYTDGLEVGSDYDPAVGNSAKLKNSAYLFTYTSSRFGYSLLYPKAWTARATDQESAQVVFSSEEASEFMEVLIVDNPEKLTSTTWYAQQGLGLKPEEVPIINSGSFTWATSLNGLNAYLATDRYIITFSYNIGTKTEASFGTLFQAILHSFNLTSEAGLPLAVTTGGITDCGLAGPVNTPGSNVYSASTITQQAWSCFVNNFESCTPARINAAMDSAQPNNQLVFEILSSANGICKISGPKVDSLTGQTTTNVCEISKKYLDGYFSESQKSNSTLSGDYLKGYLAASIVKSGSGSLITYADGTQEQVICK